MANAVPRVTPTEKGKAKDIKVPASRSQAWKALERSLGVFLQEHDGKTDDPSLARLASSTGRVGFLVSLGFDVASRHYVAEAKRRQTPKVMSTPWIQVCQMGLQWGKEPLLVWKFVEDAATYVWEGKSHKTPDLHCITEKRHAQLLGYEKEIEERDANASIG